MRPKMIYVDEQEPVGGEHLIAVDGLVKIGHFWGTLVISISENYVVGERLQSFMISML